MPSAAVAQPRAAPAEQADDGRAFELPQVAHVCVDRPVLSKMLHCEFPPERYYDALAKDMQARHPRASAHMLEHCGVVESFLDLCIVSGFALGAAKTKGRIAQVEFEWLGSVCGRTGMEACDGHLAAVRNWADITDPSGMRRFLGNFNWVRGHFPLSLIHI